MFQFRKDFNVEKEYGAYNSPVDESLIGSF